MLRCWAFTAALSVSILAACEADEREPLGDTPLYDADLVLRGGRIYTVDRGQPWAQAVAIADGRFVYVGDDAGAQRFVGARTRVSELGGRLAIPGLVDAHTHPGGMGRYGEQFGAIRAATNEDVLAQVAQYAYAHRELEWIHMVGFPDEIYGKAGPHKSELDRIVPDRPVDLLSNIGHSRWFNSLALKSMGVDRDTPDAVPGLSLFARDAAGELTGWVKEYAFAPYLAPYLKPDVEANRAGIVRFLDFLSSLGVTALMDGGAFWYPDDVYAFLAELDRSGRLPVHYEGVHHVYLPEQLPNAINELSRLRSLYAGDRLQFNTIKIHFDGSNEIRTGAVLEPFSDDPENRGNTLIDEEALSAFILKLHAEHLDLHLHTVGDRAVRSALNAVARARMALDVPLYTRVTLSHLDLIDAADYPRFRALGVIANYTPAWHAHSGVDATRSTLGPRYPNMLRVQPLLDAGAVVTFSSDVGSLDAIAEANPYFGMQTAHNRQYPPDGPDAEIRLPLSERLQLKDLIQGYTQNGAIQLGMDESIGLIEVGKLADLVVLERNLFEVNRYEIRDIRPAAVLLEGEVLHGRLP